MASDYYGLNRGQTQDKTTYTAGASGATDIEVRVDLTKYQGVGKGSKEEFIRDVEMIMLYVLRDLDKKWG